MKRSNRWLLVVLTGCLLGSSFLGQVQRVLAAPSPKTAVQVEKININRADAGELDRIKGVGPMLAERIMKYRETNGRFERLEDLIRVPGIGQAKFERIKDQITL